MKKIFSKTFTGDDWNDKLLDFVNRNSLTSQDFNLLLEDKTGSYSYSKGYGEIRVFCFYYSEKELE